MNQRLLPLLVVLASVLLLAGCAATKKAYEKGDYEVAVFNSIERLRKSPDNKKASQTLKVAYPAMVEYLEGRIAQDKKSSNPLRWEGVLGDYQVLNRAYDEIQRAPAARRVVSDARNYQSEINEATLNGAEARYALGRQELERGRQGDREAAKSAFYHFEKALALRPNHRDSRDLMLEAQDFATLYVQIEPVPMHSRSLALSNEFFESQLTEYFKTGNFSPFIRFFSAKESAARRRDPDQILRMVFDDFVVGQAYIKETVVERSRDSVVIGKVTIAEDSVVNVYGTVKAKVTRFQKEISSGGLLDVQIIDTRTGAKLSQRKFPGTYLWYDRWGFFNGDERALTDEDKQFCRKSREMLPPPPQDLFIEFTKPIFSQVTGFIGEYYRGY